MKSRRRVFLLFLVAALSFSCSRSKPPAGSEAGGVVRLGMVADSHYADTEFDR